MLMISPYSSNPTLTEQGYANVFRVCGRDTIQATMVADYLAQRWGGQDIAIVHDGQAYGKGIAEEARRRLSDHRVTRDRVRSDRARDQPFWTTRRIGRSKCSNRFAPALHRRMITA